MKRFFFATSIASLVLVACGSESTTTDSTNTTTTTDSPYITPAPDTTNNALPPVVQDTAKTSSIIKMPPATLPVSVPATQPQPSTTATGALNPEHGKPGHRCDIAVGAPLNAPAGNPAAATPTVTTAPVTSGTTAPSTGTKPKLNPAHGQPFHDCSIEVGKPLKS